MGLVLYQEIPVLAAKQTYGDVVGHRASGEKCSIFLAQKIRHMLLKLGDGSPFQVDIRVVPLRHQTHKLGHTLLIGHRRTVPIERNGSVGDGQLGSWAGSCLRQKRTPCRLAEKPGNRCSGWQGSP